jgi:hypothetical protein
VKNTNYGAHGNVVYSRILFLRDIYGEKLDRAPAVRHRCYFKIHQNMPERSYQEIQARDLLQIITDVNVDRRCTPKTASINSSR